METDVLTKQRMLQVLDNLPDQFTVDKLMSEYYILGKIEEPCQMTIEELKTEIAQAETDYEKGNYVTQEKMRQKHLV
jgi:uncharacterized membrane protein